MKINFWQDIPSLHQESLIRNLADYNDVNLIVGQSSLYRKIESGWPGPNLGNARLIQSPNDEEIENILLLPKFINILSGINVSPMITRTLKIAIKKNKLFGIQSESYSTNKPSDLFRKFRSYYHYRVYRNHIKFILAMGLHGINWFRESGFDDKQIFEFGYFINTPKLHGHQNNNRFTFIFVGRIDENKGLDILLKSLSLLKDLNWTLNIVGNGPQKEKMIKISNKYSLTDKTNFLGRLENEKTIKMIEMADLLILPSKFKEGWGTVINEALMVGTPVLCSDICGASTLFNQSNFSQTFKTQSVKSLVAKLNYWIKRGSLSTEERQKIINWSYCIDGKIAADYLLQIIEYSMYFSKKPVTPWSN